MDSSRRVTSIFIAVALLALAALAINVNRRDTPPDVDLTILPGLAENLRSIENITGYPSHNFRLIKIVRTNGDELLLARESIDSRFAFQGAAPSPSEKSAYSAILYANAVFLEDVAPDNFSVVTSITPEQQLGRLVYTSFDGLVLDNTVYRAGNATWLKMTAAHSAQLAVQNPQTISPDAMTASEAEDFVRRWQARLYKKTDEPQ